MTEQTKAPGIYFDLSNAEYHGGPGVSKSGLDLIAKSPLHFDAARKAANDDEREPTPAQRFGSAFHALVLEPEVFRAEYCLALRRQDVPEAIDDREVLAAMVEKQVAENLKRYGPLITKAAEMAEVIRELNSKRKRKLQTGLMKSALVDVIVSEDLIPDGKQLADLEGMKAAELKAIIEAENENREGHISVSGSMEELATRAREAGAKFTLLSEADEAHQLRYKAPLKISTSANRHEMAAWLNAHGHNVTLWSDVQAEWQANNASRTVLSQEDWDALHEMKRAVFDHPAAKQILTGKPGKAEVSAYWHDPETGVLCRCRPDFWREDGILADLKTTDDASPEGFSKTLLKWRYHVQAPYYMDGAGLAMMQGRSFPELAPPKGFAFIAVEKKPPYAVAVYVLGKESLDEGREEYARNLSTYAECAKNDNWPGYDNAVQIAHLPEWHLIRQARAKV